MKALLFVSCIFILFLSCSKDNSGNWIVMRVRVLDYSTHEPVSCKGSFKYKSSKGYGNDPDYQVKADGISYDGNYMVVKYKIPRKEYAHRLELFGPWNYGYYGNPFTAFEVSPGSDEDVTVYIKCKYRYNLRLHNLSCSGPTDSLFITAENISTKKFAGCQDTLFAPPFGSYGTSYSPNLYLKIISKKNGVYDTLSQNFNLIMGELNEVEINY